MDDFGNRYPRIMLFIIAFFGLIIALFIGQGIGQGNIKPAAIAIGALIAMAVYFTLGRNAWMLMIFCWPLTGRISILPLPFSVREIGVYAAFAAFLAALIFKQKQNKPLKEKIDLLLWLNLAWLGVAFARNPVGFNFLGTDRIGGGPYMNVAIALMAFLVLRQICAGPKVGAKIPYLMFGGTAIVTFIGVLTTFVPQLVPFVAPFYSGLAVDTYMKEQAGKDSRQNIGEDRLNPASGLGTIGVNFCVSRWKPSSLLNIGFPFRFGLFSFSLIGIFLGGFRSALLAAMAVFLISSLIQEKFLGLVRNMLLMSIGLFLLIVLSLSDFYIPKTAQRALSWLPGFWGTEAEMKANESTEWRVRMWEIAWSSDKYIQSKILGDGFGFSKQDFEKIMTANRGYQVFTGPDAKLEPFLIQGQFHSGALTTIRVVGIIGLLFFLSFMIAQAFYAYDLVRLTKDTPFQFPSLFICIGAIFTPFNFIFVFGSFGDALPACIFGLGVMKMIKLSFLQWDRENSLQQPTSSEPLSTMQLSQT